MVRRLLLALLNFTLLAILPSQSLAQPAGESLPSPDVKAILERLDRLEQENQRLRQDLEEYKQGQRPEPSNEDKAVRQLVTDYLEERDRCRQTEARQTQETDAGPTLLQAIDKAPAAAKKAEDAWIDVSRENWTVRLGGHVQMDYIVWPYADPAIDGAINYFSFRRLRLAADGTGFGVLDFRLQLTLEPGDLQSFTTNASPEVKDAYLSMNEIPLLGRIRIGNFFVPFGLEQVTNDRMNVFLERSIPTQNIFTADREPGIALYNCTADESLSWYTGLFFDTVNDAVKTRFDMNQGYRLSGRLVYVPYYDVPSDGRYVIHTGAGVLHTRDNNDSVVFRARPQVQKGPFLIDSGGLFADYYTTGNLEFAIVWGPVTLQSEAYLSRVNMLEEDPVLVGGAYAHLSYFLTGENRRYERFGQHGAQFGATRPFSNFFIVPGGIGWGAWEFKARWSYLNLNSVDSGEYNDFTIGFNWYWNYHTRIMFDWIHPITTPETVFGATQSDLIGMRFDFNW